MPFISYVMTDKRLGLSERKFFTNTFVQLWIRLRSLQLAKSQSHLPEAAA